LLGSLLGSAALAVVALIVIVVVNRIASALHQTGH
jgi:hypothetical protein